jgi:hypothetical protein
MCRHVPPHRRLRSIAHAAQQRMHQLYITSTFMHLLCPPGDSLSCAHTRGTCSTNSYIDIPGQWPMYCTSFVSISVTRHTMTHCPAKRSTVANLGLGESACGWSTHRALRVNAGEAGAAQDGRSNLVLISLQRIPGVRRGRKTLWILLAHESGCFCGCSHCLGDAVA